MSECEREREERVDYTHTYSFAERMFGIMLVIHLVMAIIRLFLTDYGDVIYCF